MLFYYTKMCGAKQICNIGIIIMHTKHTQMAGQSCQTFRFLSKFMAMDNERRSTLLHEEIILENYINIVSSSCEEKGKRWRFGYWIISVVLTARLCISDDFPFPFGSILIRILISRFAANIINFGFKVINREICSRWFILVLKMSIKFLPINLIWITKGLNRIWNYLFVVLVVFFSYIGL